MKYEAVGPCGRSSKEDMDVWGLRGLPQGAGVEDRARSRRKSGQQQRSEKTWQRHHMATLAGAGQRQEQ